MVDKEPDLNGKNSVKKIVAAFVAIVGFIAAVISIWQSMQPPKIIDLPEQRQQIEIFLEGRK